MSRKAMVGMTLAVALMIPLAGCASKGRMSVAKMCASHGGKYSMQTQTCNAPAMNSMKASDICQGQGGYYDSVSQTCEVGLE